MATFNIGRRIQDLLDEKDKSQSDLARYLGIKASTVSQWVSGKASPTFDKLEPISRFFHMSLPDLVSNKTAAESTPPVLTIVNDRNDLYRIPIGSCIRVEIGTAPEIGDIVLYKSGNLMRFLRLAAYRDGISVLMSDIDDDPPVISTNAESEIIGTATAIMLKEQKKESISAGRSETDSLVLMEDKHMDSPTEYHNT